MYARSFFRAGSNAGEGLSWSDAGRHLTCLISDGSIIRGLSFTARVARRSLSDVSRRLTRFNYCGSVIRGLPGLPYSCPE